MSTPDLVAMIVSGLAMVGALVCALDARAHSRRADVAVRKIHQYNTCRAELPGALGARCVRGAGHRGDHAIAYSDIDRLRPVGYLPPF